jgi:hypothetical protein
LPISAASPTRPTPATFKAALPMAIIRVTGIRIDAIPFNTGRREGAHQRVSFVAAERFFKKDDG